MSTEIILERTVNGVEMQCGYVKEDGNSVPFIKIGTKVAQFNTITLARAAFWNHVKR